jgi:hypothetical protein
MHVVYVDAKVGKVFDKRWPENVYNRMNTCERTQYIFASKSTMLGRHHRISNKENSGASHVYTYDAIRQVGRFELYSSLPTAGNLMSRDTLRMKGSL